MIAAPAVEVSVVVERPAPVLACGARHSLAVLAYGRVLAAGRTGEGACEVARWRDVVAVAAGAGHTLGLRGDGTLLASGDDRHGRCAMAEWRCARGEPGE